MIISMYGIILTPEIFCSGFMFSPSGSLTQSTGGASSTKGTMRWVGLSTFIPLGCIISTHGSATAGKGWPPPLPRPPVILDPSQIRTIVNLIQYDRVCIYTTGHLQTYRNLKCIDFNQPKNIPVSSQFHYIYFSDLYPDLGGKKSPKMRLKSAENLVKFKSYFNRSKTVLSYFFSKLLILLLYKFFSSRVRI